MTPTPSCPWDEFDSAPCEWTEVWSIVDGTQGNSIALGPDEDQDEAIDQLIAEGADEVYVLPHYCGNGARGCECVQWLTDHRPVWSREQDE